MISIVPFSSAAAMICCCFGWNATPNGGVCGLMIYKSRNVVVKFRCNGGR